jgi:hypothetical protein
MVAVPGGLQVGLAPGVPDAAGVPAADGTAAVPCAAGVIGADTSMVGAAPGPVTVMGFVLMYRRDGWCSRTVPATAGRDTCESIADRVTLPDFFTKGRQE